MTGLLVAGVLLLIIGCLFLARRAALPVRHTEPARKEPEERPKPKPDLSKVPTLPPIRRKHGGGATGPDDPEMTTRRAS
jgi:hypothetical protein